MFLRERSSYLYSPGAYFISKFIASIPITIISCGLFTVIMYYSTGLNYMFGYKIYVFYGTIMLMTLGGTMYAYFLASLVTNQNTLSMASIVRTYNNFLHFR